jgi:ATP-binding protein involved in chromosome partitioning
MSQPSREDLEVAIAGFTDPYLEQDLVTAKCLRQASMDGTKAVVEIVLGYPAKQHASEIEGQLDALLKAVEGVEETSINIKSAITAHVVQEGVDTLANVKNIIAVASGKGGVGKSTVAVNLALALAAEGATVGMLDADIYGPSQPRMLGLSGQPDSKDGKSLEPMMGYGIQTMSIGFLVDDETPMIWRGPMVTQALEQLLRDTQWRDLDYMIIDLPPGTGDIQLTLSQRVPVSGAVIVTTPQDIALLDARKGLKMFEKVKVPVLGVVENMSTYKCSNCGNEEHIFGSGGGERMAKQYQVDLLGALPLDINIRQDVDGGQPTMVKNPEGDIAKEYRSIALKVAAALSKSAKDLKHAFPKIVIQ